MLEKLKLEAACLFIDLLMAVGAAQKQGRATHPIGVGATGKLRIVENPQFPAHDFFRPSREFPVTLRHAQVGTLDDAASDVRSASFRLTDPAQPSPLDLVMNSGPAGTFWDIPTFLAFVRATRAAGDMYIHSDKQSLVDFYTKYPLALKNTQDRLRRAPDSFTQIYYYSQVAFRFTAQDNKPYYVKYRLIPADRGAESGILSAEDRAQIWHQERKPGETRPPNYLRREFQDRLLQDQIIYHLQLQLHKVKQSDSPEILHSGKPWVYPWLDLATIMLDRFLPDEITEKLRFNPGNQPPSLGVIPAASIHDYNSVVYARIRSYPFSQAVRALLNLRN